ncbi:MAG TPA: hypothetical protein EYQ27_11370, partial [Gemmatimonadetes bacterium]|nr:hypothetical protein [Gemmatimonadota bacterium]
MTSSDRRFERQVRFAPLGAEGQGRLESARVLLVGCGALGGILAQTLTRAGVGELVLVDRDLVEETNLPRQVLFEDRHAEDHVYCMFEFPGPGYEAKFDVGYRDTVNNVPSDGGVPDYSQDPNKKIVVTYSSINGNGFGGYGEIVMGTKGTLVLEKEKEVMLFQGSNTSTRVGVKADDGGATLDTQASGEDAPVAKAAETGP